MTVSQLIALGGVILLANMSPGPDFVIVTRNALMSGRRAGMTCAAGIAAGVFVWAVVTAVGISGLLAASAVAFTVVKLAGAAYLVFLGVQSLLSAWRSRDPGHARETAGDVAPSAAGAPARRVPSMRTAYLQGVISTVLNPKPALLFLTFLPQFVDTSRAVLPQILFLATVHIVIGLIWLTIYAHLIHRAHRTLTRSDVKRWLEGATGVVLIALGLRVAVEPR